MVKSAPALSAFTAGELSPKLEGRIDLEKYRSGCSELTNLLVLPQGGTTRRPGTEFLGQVKDSADVTRLIPFQFKTSDTYILEFGDSIMRVYRNGLQVLNSSAKAITGITQANPGVLTSSSHGFSNGDEVYVSISQGMTELSGRNYLVANSSTNTFTLTDLHGTAINTTAMTAYSAGGTQTATEIFELATPYPSADINELNFVQSADTMYLVHPSYAIRTLTRTGHNSWAFSTPSLTSASNNLNASSDNYPSVVGFFEQRLIFAGTNNAPQTLWFSKSGAYTNFTVGTNDDDALEYTLASQEVNAIRWLSSTRVLVIGTSGGEYVVSATNDAPVSPTNTVIRKYSTYGSAKHKPVQVADTTLFLQRNKRKVREFKYVGDVDESGYAAPDMTVLSDHITEGGIEEFAYQQEPDSIVWCRRNDGTLLGLTYRREEQVVAWHKHVIGGRFGDCTITVADYANIVVGSKIILTLANGTQITLQSETAGSSSASTRSGNTIYYRPNTNNDTTADNIYTALNGQPEFTVANPSAAVVTVYETSPGVGLLTATTTDKVRLAVTDQGQAVVDSIASLSAETGEDELYLIVKRTIKGVTKKYIEKLKSIDFGNETHEGWFVDSALAYPTAWPTPDHANLRTSLFNFYHLEGETIQVAGNGAAHIDKTVGTDGSISLTFSCSSAVAGYGYVSNLKTTRLESGSQDGTSQGKPKRVHGVTVRLLKTVGLDVGTDDNNIETIPFRDSSMNASEAVPLFTGDKEIEFTGAYDENDKIFVRQSQPLPLTVLAIYPRLTTFDI